jgi:hypothetical protein
MSGIFEAYPTGLCWPYREGFGSATMIHSSHTEKNSIIANKPWFRSPTASAK